LKPKTIISVRYIQPENMHKIGIQLPGILKWIMKLTIKKFDKAAKKNHVKLIGQVTGADGKLMQKASDFASEVNYIIRTYPTLTMNEIQKNGLTRNDVGKVILF
jgi:hypothetical protein